MALLTVFVGIIAFALAPEITSVVLAAIALWYVGPVLLGLLIVGWRWLLVGTFLLLVTIGLQVRGQQRRAQTQALEETLAPEAPLRPEERSALRWLVIAILVPFLIGFLATLNK
jgi:hypothetical protein